MMECPICGETFKDGRGLHGHLRFKEGLQGEKLERVYNEAKDMQAAREREAATRAASESNTAPFRYGGHGKLSLAMEKVSRLVEARRNKERLQNEMRCAENAAPMSLFISSESEVWGALEKAFRKEVAKAEEEVEAAKRNLKQTVERLAESNE